MKHLFLATATVGLMTTPVLADEFSDALKSYFDSNLANWAQNDRLVDAIAAQNSDTIAYDQAMIDQLDADWRAQVGQAEAPLVSEVVGNPLSDFLREAVDGSNGAILEIFVMDARGLNVAASAPTSDYWQGDEAKFSETYGVGAGAAHISDVEFDESTQSYQGQVSVTITDPATGDAVGAITFGVDPQAVM